MLDSLHTPLFHKCNSNGATRGERKIGPNIFQCCSCSENDLQLRGIWLALTGQITCFELTGRKQLARESLWWEQTSEMRRKRINDWSKILKLERL